MTTALPIEPVLPSLIAALRAHGRAVLQAPPGAGKTTRVPLAMLDAGICAGRIVMLEPRRLAARAAAERMAQTRGEEAGQTVGYRMRGAAKLSVATRIEVVTEGILTRMLQTDPDLPGVSAIIFDEFHERSLNADFGLALCLEVAEALREDLMLVVMSATLDAAPVAALMNAPVLTSQGRSFPVETRHLPKPLPARTRRDAALADLVRQAEADTRASGGGGILVFLPGAREIRQAEAALRGTLPGDVEIAPLYGALPFAAQQLALTPAPTGRKLVLATSIAETSLTIEGVRVVVDGGMARRARFDPGSGMSRLVTERVSRAEADQRRGRAGRLGPGVCYRLWTRGEEGALRAFPPAEIEVADLADLALQLALWGARPGDLSFLTPPPEGPLAEARALLTLLGALDRAGRITAHGRVLATLPLHPRLAHMLTRGGADAAALAALLSGRDVLAGGPVDLGLRIEALRDPRRFARMRGHPVNHAALEQARSEARRLAARRGAVRNRQNPGTAAADGETPGIAEQAALAYPDRIGQRRPGDAPRYLLSGGKGARLPDGDPLAGAPWIVATDLDGDPREARVRMAVQIPETSLRELFADRIGERTVCEWSRRDRRVIAERRETLGALILSAERWPDAPQERMAAAMLDGVRDLGLRLSGGAARLAARVELARASGAAKMPDMSEPGLVAALDDWLAPFLGDVRSAADWKRFDPLPALEAYLGWEGKQRLQGIAPGHFTTPLGRRIPVDYTDGVPAISVRLQEMFGVGVHPLSAGQAIVITLLSPAHKPVQITRDLPGFWDGSYGDVRKDMRAQYPKHPWPEDPRSALPTLRAKPRR